MSIATLGEGTAPSSGAKRPFLITIWLALATLILLVASPGVSQNTHVVMASIIGVALILLSRFDRSPLARILFLSLAGFIVARYLIWRTLTTLTFHDHLSFTFAIVLFIAELYGVAIFFLGAIANIKPFKRQPAALPEDESLWPSVDVFVPSYNESSEVLETTLLAAKQMSYAEGKSNVFLLDDGGTDQKCEQSDPGKRAEAIARRKELQALCEEIGVGYLTRRENNHAKAGNINAALEHTSGDLVLILDADHVPTQDFLMNTAGRFLKDPKLFMVQTPHFALNPDPVERNLKTFKYMPSEQEMFYSGVQHGLDHWNASSFCGSAAVLRRSCLEEIGGIAGKTITEDAETALELHARGYNSEYIGRPMIAGLAPSTIGAFITQRSRWAQGMLQIFMLANPLLKRGLSLAQRFCYMNSCLFWFFPLVRVIFILAPCAFLVFGLKVYSANWQSFLLYAIPYLVTVWMTANFLYGRLRWPFISDLYETIQAVHLVPAVLQALFRPKSGEFKVTPKKETLEKDFISSLGWPVQILFLLNVAVLAIGINRMLAGPDDVYATVITLFWAGVNTIILAGALGAITERRVQREETIVKVNYRSRIKFGDHEDHMNLTEMGNRFCWSDKPISHFNIKAGSLGTLVVQDENGKENDLQVRYKGVREVEGSLLTEFEYEPKHTIEKAARVRLMYGDSQRWVDFQAGRQRRLGFLTGTFVFMFIAIKGFLSHLNVLITGTTTRETTAQNDQVESLTYDPRPAGGNQQA